MFLTTTARKRRWFTTEKSCQRLNVVWVVSGRILCHPETRRSPPHYWCPAVLKRKSMVLVRVQPRAVAQSVLMSRVATKWRESSLPGLCGVHWSVLSRDCVPSSRWTSRFLDNFNGGGKERAVKEPCQDSGQQSAEKRRIWNRLTPKIKAQFVQNCNVIHYVRNKNRVFCHVKRFTYSHLQRKISQGGQVTTEWPTRGTQRVFRAAPASAAGPGWASAWAEDSQAGSGVCPPPLHPEDWRRSEQGTWHWGEPSKNQR